MIKLIEVLPNIDSFNEKIINKLEGLYYGAEWLNDNNCYTKKESIYQLLILKYGDRFIRYDNKETFINKFVFDLADLLPDIFAKQQVFIKNQLSTFLSEAKNRAVVITSDNTANRDNVSNSKLGTSASPLNLVISNASDIENVPVTSSNLSNVKLIENYNSNNEQVNYDFVSNLTKSLNADYSLRLNKFMELLGYHFVSIIGNYKVNSCVNIKDYECMFNNGYVVNEVDYLCLDNRDSINFLSNKIDSLREQVNNISVVNGYSKEEIDNKLIVINQDIQELGNELNTLSLNINQELDNFYTKEEINNQQQRQDEQINVNKNNISNIITKYNELVNAFNDATLINYCGEWVEGTTAELGQVWSFNNNWYLCEVEETTTPPTNTTDWNLLSAPTIDLSNYYTKSQIDNMIGDINTDITNLQTTVNNNVDRLHTIDIGLENLYFQNRLEHAQMNQYIANLETNLQNQINEIKNTTITLFYKGQIMFFNTEKDFVDNLKTPLNLVVNVDYQILEYGNYLRTHNNGATGGSNIITENNIQQIRKSIIKSNVDLYTGKFNNDSVEGWCKRDEGSNTNYTSISNVISPNISIGTTSPQEFLPKFKNVYAIVFLKDIIK